MDVCSILIVDDHEIVAAALTEMLGDLPDFSVVGSAGNCADALGIALRTAPSVVLADHRLPDGNGAQLGAELRQLLPTTAVLILTAEPTADVVTAALESGCAGVIGKTAPVQELLAALRSAAAGRTYFTRDALAAARQHDHDDRLSEREREVLQRIAAGSTTHDIASDMNLSEHTIRNHLRRALARLGARNRLDAVVLATQRGEITIDRSQAR